MGVGGAWRYVKVDLIPRDVEEGGWGGRGVEVCEGRFDS